MRWCVSKPDEDCFACTSGGGPAWHVASSCRGSDESADRSGTAGASSSVLRVFPWPAVAAKSLVVKIAKRRPMPCAVLAGIGGTKTIRAAPPASASLRPDFQWPELVEPDRRAVARPLVHVATDHFSYRSVSGRPALRAGPKSSRALGCSSTKSAAMILSLQKW